MCLSLSIYWYVIIFYLYLFIALRCTLRFFGFYYVKINVLHYKPACLFVAKRNSKEGCRNQNFISSQFL